MSKKIKNKNKKKLDNENVSVYTRIMKALTSITTMQELADAAGVSIASVSRVFSGSDKVSEKTKEKVMELVRQSGFYPNETARTMAAGKSRLIAVILPDVENPFFSKLLSEIEEICVKKGYTMIFFNSRGDSEKEREIVAKMMARQADGMLVGITKDSPERVSVLKTAKFPVVAITRGIEGFSSVGINHREGGKLAAKYLFEQKCKEFFFFGQKEDEKFAGFKDELLKNGVQEEKIQFFGDKAWYFTDFLNAEKVMDEFMQKRDWNQKTGLFCINDLFAVQAISSAHRNKIKIPDELSIVGFDNTILCNMVYPTLTSISQPLDKIASDGFALLTKKIKEESEGLKLVETIELHPSIVVRET